MFKDTTAILGGRYVLHEQLGLGSMGTVYRATDRFTGRQVALKRVINQTGAHPDDSTLSDSMPLRIALAHEFQMLASMRHPNIIDVLDYGFDAERQPFVTMELLRDTQTILDAGRGQSLAAQVDLLVQMLRALTYMHRRGIIHRDLKPTNVLVITPEHPGDYDTRSGKLVKVLDFGLAIGRADERNLNGDGITGTLAYMAPEVVMGLPATEAADLYAVGIMACELLAGRHPFDTLDAGKLIQSTLYETPDFDALDVGERLMPVLKRLLAKTPEERYASADEAIAAFCEAVGQPVPPESRAVRESFLQAARFVGRDMEMAELTDSLHEAIAGCGSAWLIGGESGVGKSRLINELRTLALVRGALVLRGQAVSEGGTAYPLWQQSLRSLVAVTPLGELDASILASIVPDIDALLERPIAPAPEMDAAAAQTRLFVTIGGLLKRQPMPLVLLLEDLHWAGDDDLALLTWLSGIVRDLPLLLVATYSDDERPDLPDALPEMQCMKLQRLPENAIAELSGSMLGEAGRQAEVVDLLQRETEGNVFFLVEVVRVLAEEAGRLDQIGQAALPERVFSGGVREVVQRRLDRLPESARPLLKLAAVIGRQIDPVLLRAATGAAVDDWLTVCSNGAVLSVQDGVWRFSHDKLRDGVLESLSEDEARALHRQAAEVIEKVYPNAPQYYTALAHHWAVAGDAVKEGHYAARVGAQVLSTSAYAEAARYLQRALELLTKRRRAMRVTLQAQLAEAYAGLSQFDQAKALYEANLETCRETGDTRGSAQALVGLGTCEEVLGNYQPAERYYQDALALYREEGHRLGEAQALEKLASVAYLQGDFQRAEKLAYEALAVNRAIRNRIGIADILKNLGRVSAGQGDYPAARRYFDESLQIYREIGQKQGISGCLNNLGIISVYLGDLEAAKRLYYDSLAIKAEMGDRRARAATLNNLSIVTLRLGEYEETKRALEEAMSIYESVGDRQGVADTQINLGRALFALGDLTRAAELLHKSKAICADIGDLWGVAMAMLNLGRIYREIGNFKQAAIQLHLALQCAYDIQKPSTVVALLVEHALLWAAQGRRVAALELLGVALDHPAIEAEYQQYADTLYAEISATMPPEMVATALERHEDVEAAVRAALKCED